MKVNNNEEGETRLGCFSDSFDDSKRFVDNPTCPKCGSHDYQLIDDKTRLKYGKNCRCADCGFMYNFYFNV